MPLQKVGLVINSAKSLALRTGEQVVEWLEARSYQPLLLPEGAQAIGRPDLEVPPGPEWGEAELVVILGGDGTLIRAAQMCAPMNVPMLGVNTGHLGFLTEIEGDELFEQLEPFLEGHYVVEERMMLTARVEREGQIVAEMTALNDAVVSKGPRARLVHLKVSVGGTVVARYPADGVVVATPTGSTAYSLSAGGPIVGPTVEVLVVTPICPHSMNSRSVVVNGTEQVAITVEESPGEVGLSADGSDPTPLFKGDVIRVSRAPYSARLIRRHSYRFYEVLRQKLANPWR